MGCELCGRDKPLNFHHLIPRTLHKSKWYKSKFSKEELCSGIMICEDDCHFEIHKFLTPKEMGRKYNTLDKLKSHPKVKKYIEWIKNK